jgi:hypothetical protein
MTSPRTVFHELDGHDDVFGSIRLTATCASAAPVSEV